MRNRLSQLFNLPFLLSHSSPPRAFLSLSKVHLFLGSNFYSRLNTIYTNLLQSFQKRNYTYIDHSFESGLARKLKQELQGADREGYRFRLVLPRIKPKPVRNRSMERVLAVRERVWGNGITRIGLQCRVYFGQRFHRDDPLHLRPRGSDQGFEGSQEATEVGDVSQEDSRIVNGGRVWRVGQFRYIRYYGDRGLVWNLRNMYNQQTFELVVRYASKMYLEVQPFDQSGSGGERKENQPEKEVVTEIVMRTGNDKFDWVIVRVNNIEGTP